MFCIHHQARGYFMLLLAAVTLFAGCTPPGPRALLEGKRLIDQRKYPEAVQELRQATKLMSTNALAWLYLGLACHYSGQNAEAEKAYQKSLALDRDLSEAHLNLGSLWLEQNKLEGAKAEFTAYTLRRNDSALAFRQLGTAHLRLRETTAAERAFAEALKLDTNSVQALNGLGMTRLQRNRYAEAAAYFKQALLVNPDYRPALLNLAVLSQQQFQDRAAAAAYYRRYLAGSPPPPDAERVAEISARLEKELAAAAPAPPRTNAVALAQAAPAATAPATNVVRAPETKEPERKKDAPPAPAPQPARTVAAKPPATESSPPARSAEPSKPAPRVATAPPEPAPSNASSRPVTPARPAASTNLELVKLQDSPTIKVGGDVSLHSGRPASPAPPASSSTAADSEKAGSVPRVNAPNPADRDGKAKTSPPPPSFPRYAYKSPPKPRAGDRAAAERAFAQGYQAYQAQRYNEAIQAYRSATQLDPSFYNAQYNLALAAAESGSQRTALAAYEQALVLQPDSIDARYNFALLLKQSGYPLDAASQLETLLARYPNDTRSHLALGNLCAQSLNQPDKAREHYLRVLQADPRNPQAGAIHYWLAEHPK